jgi:hypothetical protein
LLSVLIPQNQSEFILVLLPLCLLVRSGQAPVQIGLTPFYITEAGKFPTRLVIVLTGTEKKQGTIPKQAIAR